ncbi:choice-of-anchor tandem repeat GloVer-containing protein [Methylocystis heyeri]|uniref:Uncharacterized protein n=1 Tax=Methylocystis heyeri TaxID=391905 RepID=A0A6B8KH74_9HYPH|nr:choice-of-anchor tandem repeat GloVer-containing protein [Methylocystis heyeri]QGM46315.1 hypothetical protein H2LOC_011750 [Methylocystis heyeri]
MDRDTLYAFRGSFWGEPEQPNGDLILGSDGALYGMSVVGGKGNGTVFRVAPPPPGQTRWTETTLYSFTYGADGAYPGAGPIFGADGALYGTTAVTGVAPYLNGTVFRLAPPTAGETKWTLTTLYTFTGGADGGQPASGLILGTDGALYGTTWYGGTGTHCQRGCGTVFKLTPPSPGQSQWTETVIHCFQGGRDGVYPNQSLIFGRDGALYGVTQPEMVAGGFASGGTVFKLTPPPPGERQWTETVLYNFNSWKDGLTPSSPLILDTSGSLYGLTVEGGATSSQSCGAVGCGTVFKLAPPTYPHPPQLQWDKTILYSFHGGDGEMPNARLVFDTSGALYGVTLFGGTGGNGVAFKLQNK